MSELSDIAKMIVDHIDKLDGYEAIPPRINKVIEKYTSIAEPHNVEAVRAAMKRKAIRHVEEEVIKVFSTPDETPAQGEFDFDPASLFLKNTKHTNDVFVPDVNKHQQDLQEMWRREQAQLHGMSMAQQFGAQGMGAYAESQQEYFKKVAKEAEKAAKKSNPLSDIVRSIGLGK